MSNPNNVYKKEQSTLSIVKDLKEAGQDYEWYPTTNKQIEIITNDIMKINEDFSFTARNFDPIKVLDIGAGDGRVLQAMQSIFEKDDDVEIDLFAVEKASVHTSRYRSKGITLLGTEFDQINFISKHCHVAFVNPPYSCFSYWLDTLIKHLNFGVLYAVIPQRWADDSAIKEAMKLRGLKYAKVLAESDFSDAERKARAKVDLVRFSFEELNPETLRVKSDRYRPTVGIRKTDSFQLFIENELGLRKSYSETTKKFSEEIEKKRIRDLMQTEGTTSFELVKSKGILSALLDNYERDLTNTLEQYKLISQIDSTLLQELGVDYDGLCASIKEKSFGYRHVYWSLLFEKLDAISSRLTSTNKTELINTLSANALDFTYTNAIYIIHYAVELGNELTEKSLIAVYKNLTSSDAISRYYKSNEHVFNDSWRHSSSDHYQAKFVLDYRFVFSSWSNFNVDEFKNGLNVSARNFTNDLMVAFKLLGYNDVKTNTPYDDVITKQPLSVFGTKPDGTTIELIQIKFYKNGNRHLKFNQTVMLRLNVTVSRLLGWVRSKTEFETELETTQPISKEVWGLSDSMKLSPNSVLKLEMAA